MESFNNHNNSTGHGNHHSGTNNENTIIINQKVSLNLILDEYVLFRREKPSISN